jgi:sugar lactone lactonase YvrE
VLCAALVAQAMACYSPDPAQELPCSPAAGECPDGQQCGVDNVCRSAGAPVPDAAPCPVDTCEVEVLATSLTSADVVSAAHPDYVFWTSVTGRQVLRTDKATLETTVVDEGAAPYAPLGLVADENNVYWSDNRSSGAILSSTAAPGGAVQTLATGQDFPLFLAADADSVYWGNRGGLLLRATRSAGAVSMVAASPGDGPAGALLVDGDQVYFADQGGGRVFAVARDGGDLTQLYEAQGEPLGVAADAQFVYWTNTVAGEVKRGRKVAGGAEELVASGQEGAALIAVGSTHVYWTNSGDGRVMRASKATREVEALVDGQDQPYGIAVDGDALYWVNRVGPNRLMRLYPCACL